jgi:hypothetical protein
MGNASSEFTYKNKLIVEREGFDTSFSSTQQQWPSLSSPLNTADTFSTVISLPLV